MGEAVVGSGAGGGGSGVICCCCCCCWCWCCGGWCCVCVCPCVAWCACAWWLVGGGGWWWRSSAEEDEVDEVILIGAASIRLPVVFEAELEVWGTLYPPGPDEDDSLWCGGWCPWLDRLELTPTELDELDRGGGPELSILDELDKEGGRCSCAERVDDEDEGGGGPYELDELWGGGWEWDEYCQLLLGKSGDADDGGGGGGVHCCCCC